MHNSFDDIFKNKLSNHSSSVNPNLWGGIEQQLGAASATTTVVGSTLLAKILGSVASISILIGVGYMASQLDEPSKEPEFKVISSVNLTPVKQEKVVVIDTKKVEHVAVMENTTQNSVEMNIAKTANKKQTQNIQNPSQVVSQSQAEVSTQNSTNITENQQNTQIEDKKDRNKKGKSNGIHMAGERITKRFEVQNIAGHDVKKLESWIEFPEWVDVNTVETISHTEGIEFKEIKNEKYNYVVWEVHGLISGDMKLFIEYSFVLKEPKTDQDLNKINPEIK
jgi:hypothetical protein